MVYRTPYGRSRSSDHFFDDFSRRSVLPYWRDADHSSFNFSDTVGEVINDDSKYAVQLDVSHFRPEDMKIQLDGRELKIEGCQEMKSEHGYSKRCFSKMFLMPEDVDLTALRSAISNDGKLQIEAPKGSANSSRAIPISFVEKH
ncbi:Protein CBG04605 [Caenorhabditis briggsae]|uniref:Protein CBG04605 n=1 Tax=Caenorhabditis briggsae TaxID=6238 RepID=A8WY15_CAEBR|nr:Protein CBG04605 [Caenorhabditis briggsae]CAP25275.2 Protein CBG04605 [Caenorhabditis briggsae]